MAPGSQIKVAAILFLAAAAAACTGKPHSFEERRREMVRTQIEQRGIVDPAILEAFRTVPREDFVLPKFRERALDDVEAPIGFGESLDRAYDNAIMVSALGLGPGSRVLEVGTGVGYLASVMSRIAKEVCTIDINPEIAAVAAGHFKTLGLSNVFLKVGDGYAGWPERAPFDAIVMATSPDRVPEPLVEQLSEGGRLVVPIGGSEKHQELILFRKTDGKLVAQRRLAPAQFSPMKGKILEK